MKLNTIKVTSTETGRTVEAQVASRSKDRITIFLANEKITLVKEGKVFVGNKFGMELVYCPND